MDKKQKKKTILAVCFVLVCGAVYAAVHCGAQEKDRIVLEQRAEPSAVEATGTANDAEPVTDTPAQKDVPEQTVKEEAESERMVYVHVCGAVIEEGVYTLPEGSRVIDAVTAAGGFAEKADTSYHNLATVLSDGQKVYVPTLAETQEVSVTERAEGASDKDIGAESAGTQADGRVNINTASKEELMTLSGIGEAKAESILLYRKKVGPFQRIEELTHVSGIGEAMFENIKDEIVAE